MGWQAFFFFFLTGVFFISLCSFLILYQEILPNEGEADGGILWLKYIFWSLGLFRILLQWLEKVTINYLDKSVLLSASSPADCEPTGIVPRRRTVHLTDVVVTRGNPWYWVFSQCSHLFCVSNLGQRLERTPHWSSDCLCLIERCLSCRSFLPLHFDD